jgi:hypothetical protein
MTAKPGEILRGMEKVSLRKKNDHSCQNDGSGHLGYMAVPAMCGNAVHRGR